MYCSSILSWKVSTTNRGTFRMTRYKIVKPGHYGLITGSIFDPRYMRS
jgi:hypothetical protein